MIPKVKIFDKPICEHNSNQNKTIYYNKLQNKCVSNNHDVSIIKSSITVNGQFIIINTDVRSRPLSHTHGRLMM